MMASIRDRVKNVLDESRLLVLGVQVLIGFQYRSVFEPAFPRMAKPQQISNLAALIMLLLSLALLVAPSSYHQILERGNDTPRVHRYASSITAAALLPFALGLAIDVSIVAREIMIGIGALAAGILVFALALIMWYGLEVLARCRRGVPPLPGSLPIHAMPASPPVEPGPAPETPLKDKIVQMLTEARIIIPGAQALLGFQFITFLADGFDSLPRSSKYVHLASLLFTGISVIFLMVPAAYHRIAEEGNDSERLHRLGTRMLMIAMVSLAFGITGDFYVVTRKVLGSALVAIVGAVALHLLFDVLWFALPVSFRESRPFPNKSKIIKPRSV